MRKMLILLCKIFTDRYHLNILRIIAIIYHIYIGCELYNLAYGNKMGGVYEQELVRSKKGKWKDRDYFTRDFI